MTLFATDLDNTLIHSYKTATDKDICVETMRTSDGTNKKLSFMTPKAYNLLKQAMRSKDFTLVPITTRSLEQYRRIHLFDVFIPSYALVSNGGNLLLNGRVNEVWHERSKKLILSAIPEMKLGMNLLENDPHRSFEVRFVDDMFVFTKSEQPMLSAKKLRQNLNSENVSVHCNGSKVYIMPAMLTKQNAVKRLTKMFGFERVICAGDSDFDISMLKSADISYVPDAELLSNISLKGEKQIWKNDSISYAEFILDDIINKHKCLA